MYGQFPMVSVGCPHLVNCPHKLVNSQKEEGGGPWGGGEGGLCCPPGTPSVSRCYGAARGFPVAGLQEARGPGSGWGVRTASLSPGTSVGFSLGVTAKCRHPPSVPLVSGNLDGLLILTDITLGLFELNFFSLREKTKTQEPPSSQ